MNIRPNMLLRKIREDDGSGINSIITYWFFTVLAFAVPVSMGSVALLMILMIVYGGIFFYVYVSCRKGYKKVSSVSNVFFLPLALYFLIISLFFVAFTFLFDYILNNISPVIVIAYFAFYFFYVCVVVHIMKKFVSKK